MADLGTLGKKLGKVYQPIPKKTAESPTRTGGTSASREVQELFSDHERTQLNLDGIRDLDLTSTGEINLTSTGVFVWASNGPWLISGINLNLVLTVRVLYFVCTRSQ